MEKFNSYLPSIVILTQTAISLIIATIAFQFFWQPHLRESRFPFLPQWDLEARKIVKKAPKPPIFIPAPISKAEGAKHQDFNLSPPLTFMPEKPEPLKGDPVKFEKRVLKGVPFYLATLSLRDPETFVTLSLPHNAIEANSAQSSHGDESFKSFVKRLNAAVVQNGTFFSKDKEKRVMGNMVANGSWLKYSRWENYGTTFGLLKGNRPEMITARLEGKPDWSKHWLSITCGPRLVKNGNIEINAKAEGFSDPHVLGAGSRCALGYPESKDRVYLVTFLRGLTLKKEAQVMKELGCYEAMNLDGGASRSLAHGGKVIVPAGRALTNVIVVYDTDHPAPAPVRKSWRDFQRNRAMIQLIH